MLCISQSIVGIDQQVHEYTAAFRKAHYLVINKVYMYTFRKAHQSVIKSRMSVSILQSILVIEQESLHAFCTAN